MKTFYYCKGDVPTCMNCSGCYKQGGPCKHTTKLEHAKTPYCERPDKDPDRFSAIKSGPDGIEYFEKEPMIHD